MSGDGRYIAFTSDATNLVAGDTNAASDVFVHDRQTAQTRRVSVATGGTEGDQASTNPSISGDGRYIAFTSDATNLVAGDTNAASDVFVHDRQTATTTRLGVYSSIRPAVSADGRYVAFASDAAIIVPGDTNNASDVFVHDRQTDTTTRVSVATGGTEGDQASINPSVSGDGRYVAFTSDATNLVAGDTNSASDVFIHDRQTATTTRVSVATDGTQGDSFSAGTSVSADGRKISFSSWATNLVPGDTNGSFDVFVHDRG